MTSIKKINGENPKSVFDKKVLSVIQHLFPYVKHRIYIGESTGILPKNMYSANGIIDESIIKLYEKGYDVDEERMAVKLDLFAIVDNDLDELFTKESFHQKTISTNTILEDELEKLKEDYSIDADLDLVLKTEFDDISYQQDHSEHVFLYDDNDSSILQAFEIEDLGNNKSKTLLGSLYSWLPTKVGDIIDLYVFGKLNLEEISRIKKIETKRIERIFEAVKKNFRKNLD